MDAVQEVAKQMEHPAAQVALNWVATQSGVTSAIIAATKLKQVKSSFDEASQLEPAHPYMFFDEVLQDRVRGGVKCGDGVD